MSHAIGDGKSKAVYSLEKEGWVMRSPIAPRLVSRVKPALAFTIIGALFTVGFSAPVSAEEAAPSEDQYQQTDIDQEAERVFDAIDPDIDEWLARQDGEVKVEEYAAALFPDHPEYQQQVITGMSDSVIQPFGWWDTTRKIAVCAATLAVEIAGNVWLAGKIKKVGGVKKAAEKLWEARNKGVGAMAKAIGIGAAEFIGLNEVYDKCYLAFK